MNDPKMIDGVTIIDTADIPETRTIYRSHHLAVISGILYLAVVIITIVILGFPKTPIYGILIAILYFVYSLSNKIDKALYTETSVIRIHTVYKIDCDDSVKFNDLHREYLLLGMHEGHLIIEPRTIYDSDDDET